MAPFPWWAPAVVVVSLTSGIVPAVSVDVVRGSLVRLVVTALALVSSVLSMLVVMVVVTVKVPMFSLTT